MPDVPDAAGEVDDFGERYWTEASHYRKYEDYASGVSSLRDWYQGLFGLIAGELPVPGTALDAGCGHGAIVLELLDRGWDARGFDLSEWMVAQARAGAPELAERFAVGDVMSVPFEGSFDLVISLEVLEHVEDPVAALRHLGERLTPNGRLIATTPNLRPLMPWWDPVSRDPTHINVHEPAWWSGAVRAAGLRPLRVSSFLAVPLLWRLSPVLSRQLPMGRRIGPGVLIVAGRGD